MPEYICGGVKGRSVMMNVRYHEGTSLIVTMDIKAWFPSITEQHVYYVWRRILGCSHKVARLMTTLTTYDGHLPQGAPTSTAIANLVLYSIDEPIRLASACFNVQYSSWVDDLVFSGANARLLIPIVVATFNKAGFRISRSKLKVMGPDKQRVVNGVTLGDIPGISRELRWRIRAALHRLQMGNIAEWELRNIH
jgi:RNA-directed DNA polymerase